VLSLLIPLILVGSMSGALKPATGRYRLLALIGDELFVASGRLLYFGCARSRFLGLLGSARSWGCALVL